MLFAGGASGAPDFDFAAPAPFTAPGETRALMGTTYTYRPPDLDDALGLTITTMPATEVARRVGQLSPVQCMNIFVDELRSSHDRFFVASARRPLVLGGREFPQFRWNGDKLDRRLTGVLSCGLLDGRYFVVHFVDEIRQAARSFPAIRAQLRRLDPAAN